MKVYTISRTEDKVSVTLKATLVGEFDQPCPAVKCEQDLRARGLPQDSICITQDDSQLPDALKCRVLDKDWVKTVNYETPASKGTLTR
jgi:hypothetical protein